MTTYDTVAGLNERASALPVSTASASRKDGVSAKTAPTSTTSSAASAGTITSSDFLTLLVTELKNQDPTSTQDPNAYIDQLVQVNSLQQLISINQDLTPK